MKALPDHAFSLWRTAAFLIALFFCFRPVAAQNGENPIISFHAENENLGTVLTRLASLNIMNLSFNATDPSFERKITYAATSTPIRTILEDILSMTGHKSRKVGNHTVIFPSGSTAGVADDVIPDKAYDYSKSHAVPEIETRTGDTVIRVVEVPVVIRDTLRIVDVVTKTDTVTIRDTVFIERPIQSRRTRSGNFLRDVFRFEPDREDGWALSFSYAQLLAGYNYSDSDDPDDALRQVKDAEPASLRNFSLAAAIRRNQGKFSFQTGARLTGFSNRFSYTDISTSGGFFEIDTLDVFYTVINGQQVFTYITDSTWIPLDRDALTYDRYNRIGLLELHLGMDYTFYAVEDIAVYVQGAFNAGVPLWLSGSTVQNVEGYPATELDKNVFEKWVYSYQAGAGVRYTLTNWTDIYGGLFYKRYLSPTTANHPLDRRLHGAGLKFGLLYYL
jgi:hypothetical protein